MYLFLHFSSHSYTHFFHYGITLYSYFQAFAVLPALQLINIPDSVRTIGNGTFFNSLGLEVVVFGDNSGLESIGHSVSCRYLSAFRMLAIFFNDHCL